MSLINKSKNELVEIISQLTEEIEGYKTGKVKSTTLSSEKVPGMAFSIYQDEGRGFHLVTVGYNVKSRVTAFQEMTDLQTSSFEYAMYKAKEFLITKILSPVQINSIHKED